MPDRSGGPDESSVGYADIGSGHGAVISQSGLYRYLLWREWDTTLRKRVVLIGLNPSTADAEINDRTVCRWICFAKSWGCGSMFALNAFAFRATVRREMMAAPDPVGPENDAWIRRIAPKGDPVVCCWGNDGMHLGRDAEVMRLLSELSVTPYALRVTKTGQPSHVLYLPGHLTPVRFS